MTRIAILGSTGSIGTQALDICRRHPERFRVAALTARSSREKLFEQVREFRPEMAGLAEDDIPLNEQVDHFHTALSPSESRCAAVLREPG